MALDFIGHIGRTLNEDGELEDLVPEMTKYVIEGTKALFSKKVIYPAVLGFFQVQKLFYFEYLLD